MAENCANTSLFLIALTAIILTSVPSSNGTLNHHQPPKTPEQLIEQYACKPNDTRASKPKWQKLMFGDECARAPSSWRVNYVDEMQEPYSVRVRESSLDERLANMIDTARYMKVSAPFALNFNSGNSSIDELNRRLVAGPQVDDRVCGEHLKQMLALIQDLDRRVEAKRADSGYSIRLHERDIHLARVLDSYGRYDSGFYSGQSNSIGDHDQCVGSQLMLTENGQDKLVGARYCWAQFNLEKHLNPALNGDKEKFSRFIYKRNVISTGICIPESCHSKSFAANRQLFQQLASEQFKLPKSMYLDESLELESVFCLVDKDSEYLKWSPGAMLFVVTLSGWTLLTICVTFYCKKINQQGKKVPSNLLTCLDISQSWNDLLGNRKAPQTDNGSQQQSGKLSADDEPKRVNFNAFSSVKMIAWIMVLFAHAATFSYAFTSNLFKSSMWATYDPSLTLLKSYFLVVDTFFVIGGILFAYSALKILDSMRAKSVPKVHLFPTIWLKMSAVRYLRIVPMLFLVFWFEKSLFTRLGSGPIWDHGLNRLSFTGACQETSWLRPFDFFTNTQAGLNCVPPAWFLYCDLYANILFVPPLIFMLSLGYTQLVYLITLGLTILSTVILFVQYFDQVDPALDIEIRSNRPMEMMMRTDLSSLYMAHFHRVPRVLIGILAGHALHWYQANQQSIGNRDKLQIIKEEEQEENRNDERAKHEVIVLIGGPKQAPISNPTLQKIIPLPITAQSPPSSGSTSSSSWPAWFRGPATYLALLFPLQVVLICLLEGTMKTYLGENFNQAGAILLLYITPIIWCMSNAIILLRLVTDWQDNWFARMGSNQLVKSMNKLGFGIYLLHWYIMVYMFATNTTTIHYRNWFFYSTFGTVYFYTTLLALVVFVFVENPLNKLIRKLLTG